MGEGRFEKERRYRGKRMRGLLRVLHANPMRRGGQRLMLLLVKLIREGGCDVESSNGIGMRKEGKCHGRDRERMT